MSALALLTKLAVAGTVITFSYKSAEDVIFGLMDGVSVKAAYSEMKSIHTKLMEFYTFNNRYPATQDEMLRFLEGEFDDPLPNVLTDPWQMQYIFFTRRVEILSCGPDKKPQSRDDLFVEYPKNVHHPL